jgi:hypothetical protein
MVKNKNRNQEQKQIKIDNCTIGIFDKKTRPPSQDSLDRLSEVYMLGFNKPPWDVYEWNYTPEKARKEFSRIVLTILKKGGAIITLDYAGEPIGFLIVAKLNIFVQRLNEMAAFKKLPKKLINPGGYFDTLSRYIGVQASEFESIGYLADIGIAEIQRAKGCSKMLLHAGLQYLKETGRKSAYAWTVNPFAARTLMSEKFTRIPHIGERGEGIDFLVLGRVWYATLDLPAEGRKTADCKPVIAEHYFKAL